MEKKKKKSIVTKDKKSIKENWETSAREERNFWVVMKYKKEMYLSCMLVHTFCSCYHIEASFRPLSVFAGDTTILRVSRMPVQCSVSLDFLARLQGERNTRQG